MIPDLASFFIVGLLVWQCAHIFDYRLIISCFISSILSVILDSSWRPSFTQKLVESSIRKTTRHDWSSTNLLFACLLLSLDSNHSNDIIPLLVFQTALLSMLFTFKNKILLTVCLTSLFLQIYLWGFSSANIGAFFKHAAIGTSLVVSMIVGLQNVFSVAEASLIGQTVMCSKYLWTSSKFSLNQTVSYILLASTALSISLYLVVGSAKGQTMHPLTLLGISASMFSISLKSSNITFDELLQLFRSLIQDPKSKVIIMIWTVGLGIVALLSKLYSSVNLAQKNHSHSLQIRRKSFHLIALCLFLPAAIYQIDLLRIAVSLAMCVFIMLETIRVTNAGSIISNWLSHLFNNCATSEEGQNSVVIPHVFLLFGCALPVMLPSSTNSIHALSGIISLCITDTIAALVGTKYGKHKLLGSRKSLEGLAAATAGTYMFMSILYETVQFDHVKSSHSSLAVYSFLVSLWEGISDQNDNLTLPFVSYALSKTFL